jgi:hypothetical protein
MNRIDPMEVLCDQTGCEVALIFSRSHLAKAKRIARDYRGKRIMFMSLSDVIKIRRQLAYNKTERRKYHPDFYEQI